MTDRVGSSPLCATRGKVVLQCIGKLNENAGTSREQHFPMASASASSSSFLQQHSVVSKSKSNIGFVTEASEPARVLWLARVTFRTLARDKGQSKLCLTNQSRVVRLYEAIA